MEDKYGVVQRDIPRILEAMLSFLSAIDEYRAEVQALYQPLSLEAHVNAKQIAASQTLREEVDDGAATLNVVGDGMFILCSCAVTMLTILCSSKRRDCQDCADIWR